MSPKRNFIASVVAIFMLCALILVLAEMLPASWSPRGRLLVGFAIVLPFLLALNVYARSQLAQLPGKPEKVLNRTVYVGLVLELVGIELFQSGMDPLGTISLAIGIPTFIWGCALYSKAKGYSGWVGAIGLLSLLGLLVLLLIPDRDESTGQSA